MKQDVHRTRVLLLSIYSTSHINLQLLREAHEIIDSLKRSRHQERFVVMHRVVFQMRDIWRSLLESKPHIVHICGHGAVEGILVDDLDGNSTIIEFAILSSMLEVFSGTIECVLLNTCHSAEWVKPLAGFARVVVAITDVITDQRAIAFATCFYDAIGAGETYEFAYKLTCALFSEVFIGVD